MNGSRHVITDQCHTHTHTLRNHTDDKTLLILIIVNTVMTYECTHNATTMLGKPRGVRVHCTQHIRSYTYVRTHNARSYTQVKWGKPCESSFVCVQYRSWHSCSELVFHTHAHTHTHTHTHIRTQTRPHTSNATRSFNVW